MFYQSLNLLKHAYISQNDGILEYKDMELTKNFGKSVQSSRNDHDQPNKVTATYLTLLQFSLEVVVGVWKVTREQ